MKLHIILNSIELVFLVFPFEITINRLARKKGGTHNSTKRIRIVNSELYINSSALYFLHDFQSERGGNYKEYFIFRLSFLVIT